MAKKWTQQISVRGLYNERTGRTTNISGSTTRGTGSGRGSSLRVVNATRKAMKGSVLNKQRNPKRSVKKGMKG